MPPQSRIRGATVAVIAALLLATAWLALGDRSVTPGSKSHDAAAVGAPDHAHPGALSSVEAARAVSSPVLAATRIAEPRLASVWGLPGLAAALATLCLLRRLRVEPGAVRSPVVLRGTVARRAPPLASTA